MPGESPPPEVSAVNRSHSPIIGGQGDAKRRRKVRSCLDCRRRKVQCDQVVPACARCVKGGVKCVYLDEHAEMLSRSPQTGAEIEDSVNRAPLEADHVPNWPVAGPFAALLSRLEAQERRTKDLEATLASMSRGSFPPVKVQQMSAPADLRDPPEQRALALKGKSFQTRYFGASNPESLIAHIPNLTALSKEMVESFPILIKVRQDLRALEFRANKSPRSPHLPNTQTDLHALLPPQTDTDELIELYFENYDRLYHIIHIPSFWHEYGGMWSDLSHARPHFVVLVLIMTATTRCLRQNEPWLYIAKNSSARDQALATIQLCEDWLRLQSQKHATITDFQIRFLVNMARVVNNTKSKRSWTDAGTALRHGMAAGLHRDLASSSKPTSALDMEMRRRIWFAIAEFELQSAFFRGMVSHPWPQESDCGPPNNILDDCLAHDQNLPAPRPLSELTRTSYLAVARTTFAVRYRLNSRINTPGQTISGEETGQFTADIEERLREVPQWSTNTPSVETLLLQLTLRQYLLVLHDRRIRTASLDSERDYSKMVVVDNAFKIAEAYNTLRSKGSHVVQLLCTDQLRAALSICHAIETPSFSSDCVINYASEFYASRVTSEVIEILADNIDRLGAGQQKYWIALVANALIKIKKDPAQKQAYMQEALSRMTGSYYKIMACQDSSWIDPGLGTTLLIGGTDDQQPQNTQQTSELSDDDLLTMDLSTIGPWTLEGWTIDARDFQSRDFQAFDGTH